MVDAVLADVKVRPVTDEEVEFFFQNGWVRLPGLIDREAAAMLLERAQREFGEDGRAGLDKEAPATEGWQSWLRTKYNSAEDGLFRRLAYSEELGRNAARLLGRDSSIRHMMSNISAKLPHDSGKGNPTDFHQDYPGHPYVEGGFVTAWVALDVVESDMGAMQFYSGSHKLGNLGNLMDQKVWDGWAPRLAKASVDSGPIALQPGDATIHSNGTIHGTAANFSARPRWNWAAVLIPGDARYTGAMNGLTDGMGFEPLGQLDHPAFPIIYSPAANRERA